jgi:DNA polymerase III gamma/tau subunit
MPLHTSYRAEKLEDIVGNEAQINALEAILQRGDDKWHTYLFTGPAGCGKTTLALIVARMLGVSDIDLHYINASDKRGIDMVRDVIETSKFYPAKGDVRVYIFEECHQLTPQAQEAFLKDTEKPPNHVYYLFCTTDPQKLKDTFRRRANIIEVKPLMYGDMKEYLLDIIHSEDIKEFPDKVLEKVISISDGSVGVALKYLDTIIDLENEQDAIDALDEATYRESSVLDVCQTILDGRVGFSAKWKRMQRVLDPKSLVGEPEQIRRGVLTYFEKVMLGDRAGSDVAEAMGWFLDPTFNTGRAGIVHACWNACIAMEPQGGSKGGK